MATAACELGFKVSVPKQHARLVERRTVPCDASDAQPEVPSQLVLNAGIFSVCTQEWSNPMGWSRKFAITLAAVGMFHFAQSVRMNGTWAGNEITASGKSRSAFFPASVICCSLVREFHSPQITPNCRP